MEAIFFEIAANFSEIEAIFFGIKAIPQEE